LAVGVLLAMGAAGFVLDAQGADPTITGVVTSRIARRLGAASKLTAHALAVGREAGSEVAALNMFDQGYYDRLGFGTGAFRTPSSSIPPRCGSIVPRARPVG